MGIFSSLADNTFLLSGVYVGFIIPGFDFDSNGVAFGGLGPDSFVHANRSQTAFSSFKICIAVAQVFGSQRISEPFSFDGTP